MSAPVTYPPDSPVVLGPRLARLRQRYGANAPQTIRAHQDLTAAQIEVAIAKAVADAPPLRPEQVDHIASILALSSTSSSGVAGRGPGGPVSVSRECVQ